MSLMYREPLAPDDGRCNLRKDGRFGILRCIRETAHPGGHNFVVMGVAECPDTRQSYRFQVTDEPYARYKERLWKKRNARRGKTSL